MQSNLSRRSFILSASTAAAATITHSSASAYAPSDVINVACIGTGGRCRTLMKSLVKVFGVRIAAVCDVWDVALGRRQETRRPESFCHETLQGNPRPQGHRCGADRHARSLARPADH